MYHTIAGKILLNKISATPCERDLFERFANLAQARTKQKRP